MTCLLAKGRPMTSINFRIAIPLAAAMKTRTSRILISLEGITAASDWR